MTTLLLLACLGITSVAGWSRIINGDDTDIQAHPHQVSLTYWTGQHACGGSIIDDYWVLTAAHCIDKIDPLTQMLVQTNNGDRNDPDKKVFEITKATLHPEWNKGSNGVYPNDVALLKVTTNLTDSTHRAIALATSGDFSGAICTISGWGKNGSGVVPTQLQETSGTILTGGECNSRLGSFYNHAIHICIDNPNTGSCTGDSGGPMVCDGLLAGVTSFGEARCATKPPSVYARVTKFYNWIVGVLNASN